MDTTNDPIGYLLRELFEFRPLQDGNWQVIGTLPSIDQGWKLHVSATVANAVEVLSRIAPILREHRTAFKTVTTLGALAELNAGVGGLSQVGKFVTIYPRNDEEAVEIAAALDAATHGLVAPRVPSDNALSPRSLVSYRYGAFREIVLTDELGQRSSALRHPNGDLVPDLRGLHYSPYPYAIDPFLERGLVKLQAEPRSHLLGGYFVLSVLRQSAKGGVYLALDPKTDPARTCVIKESRRGCGVGFDGTSGHDRLLCQHELLTKFAHLSLPRVFDLFEHEDNLYLVLEHIEGDTLEELSLNPKGIGSRLPYVDVLSILRRVCETLGALHDAGIVFRDVTPSNILLRERGPVLIDFELAFVSQVDANPYGWGTPGYVYPLVPLDPASIKQDIYGLGATLFFALTAFNPDFIGSPEKLSAALRGMRPDLPHAIVELVSTLTSNLALATSTVHSMADVTQLLDAAIQPGPTDVRRAMNPPPPPDFLARATSLADRLVDEAKADVAGLWMSGAAGAQSTRFAQFRHRAAHLHPKRTRCADLHNGGAGIALLLCEVSLATEDTIYMSSACNAMTSLLAEPELRPALPGLHFGVAGIAAAAAHLGHVADYPQLTAAAAEMVGSISETACHSPDLTHGLAGIGVAHLLLAEAGIHQSLTTAISIGDALLSAAIEHGPGIAWRQPVGSFDGMSGEILPGMAHGAAGVGTFLLQLFRASGLPRFLVGAKRTASYLQDTFVSNPFDSRIVNWPTTTSGTSPDTSWFFWCHGVGGIAVFLLELAAETGEPEITDLARQAAISLSLAGRRGSATICHGLPGNGLALLRAGQVLGDPSFTKAALDIGSILDTYWRGGPPMSGQLPSERPDLITADLMVGYAGAALFFLRGGTRDVSPPLLRVPVV